MNKHSFLFFLFLFFAGGCTPQQPLQWAPFYWISDTISGKYIEKAYIYIPVKVENLPYEFTMQFDLGTYNSLFYGNSIESYLVKHPDWANKIDSMGMYRNIRLKIGNLQFNQLSIGHKQDFGDFIPKDSLNSNTAKHIGTIASDIFQDKILIIDYPNCRFSVTESLPEKYKKLPAGKFELTDGIMKLPFRINGQEQQLMFDTGSSPFPLVTTKERAMSIAHSNITDSLSGPLWWGEMITFYGHDINKPIEFDGKQLQKLKVYYDKDGLWEPIYKAFNVWGITGNAYFFDKTLIIDYQQKLIRISD